jgi:PAS domain S-box-containing protein
MKSMNSTAERTNERDVLRILVEQAPVGVCIMQDGKFCYVNSYFPIAIGYTADELIGKDSLEIVIPEDREMVKEKTIKMLNGELPSPYQFRVICKDGSIIWVMATVKSVRYHGRKAILGNYMEITGRKQVEDALKESEERYRELANSITDVFFAMDEHLRYTYWNKASEALTGIRAQDAIGKSLREIFPDKPWRRRAEKVYRSVLRTQQPQTFVNDYDIDGRRYIFEISAYPSKNGIAVFVRDITVHKQAEDARREAEEEKSALLEEAPVNIVHTDLNGKITYVNQRFESESGYSRGEVIGKNGFGLDWFPAGTLELLAKRMVARLRGSPAEHWETRFKCKDGRWIWIGLEGKILRRSGVPVGFQIIATNITERKQMEEALRRSEGRYRTMLEEMEEGYYEVDIVGNFTFVNDAMSHILGYSRDELLGMNYKTYTPEEDFKTIFEAYNRVYRTGEPLKWFPMVEVRRDGTRVLVEDSVLPMRDDKGEVIGFRGVSRDVTEHRRAEEALRQSEERYRTILEEMEDAYFEVDLGGHLTFINSSLCRDLGYSKEELMGKSYKDFTAQEDTESVFGAFNKVYQTGLPNKGFAWKTVRKDGAHGFAETSISLLRNDKGAAVGFRGVGRDIAERKKAEEALNIQRAYFQQLFDTSPDAIIMTDTKDRAIQVNKGFERLFGYHDEETRGRSLVELIVPEEDAQEASKSLERILRGETIRKEAVRRRRDGSLADVSILAYPIHSNGKLIGAYGIYTDITDRKKQEQALADELTRRRLLIDQSLDGIVVLDVDAKVVEANQRFAEMLGYTLEEVHELHTWDWDRQYPRKKILEMGRGVDEKGFHLETKHTRKDGSVIDVDISIHGAMCAGQKLIFCVCRDITERNKMDKAIKQAAEEWKRTFDSITDGISIHDREFRILQANKAFADIFHMEPSQIIGRLCYELHKGQKPHSGCPHKQTLATKEPAGSEFYESNLGKYLHESTSPIFNEKGEVVATVHITRDVTEQKQQNERLMMTDRLASLGELASGAAHELNNPLTSIIGFAQLLMEKETPDDIREDLKLIYSEAQRAVSVTNNLLSFARKHTPRKQPNQINSIIEDVLELRAHEHKVNHIDVDRYLDPNLPEIMVDYFQMQQLFMNIIINAEYFMITAHNRGTLTITTQRQNSTVRISIADDGPGILPGNLGRIFDPFFTTKEAGKGTGLGLSICHGIVTEHGGQIYVRSQLGKGATIFIELPTKSRAHIEGVL